MIPLLMYGIVVIIFSSATFKKSMQQQVCEELENVASLVDTLLDTAYPGDYTLQGDTALSLYKGGVNITNDYSLIDGIRKSTGMDVTLFYQDTRILTTIKNWNGERIIGTQAPEQMCLEKGNPASMTIYSSEEPPISAIMLPCITTTIRSWESCLWESPRRM